MGHYDLTVSMGIPAQFDHPRFLDAMDQLVTTCRKHKKAPGFLPPNPTDAKRWIQSGFQMISMGSDISIFKGAVRSFRNELA
jgi:2-dehydro-3-deoxyglucarate aldolase/4-hydroxy-2-oxoheptanedioate aldolase